MLSLTFFVATVVTVLVYSSNRMLNYFETRPQIIAFLKDDASQENISDLEHRLSTDSRVKNIKYISKEDALSIYKSATADKPLLGQLVSPTIFPASLEFSVTDLSYAQTLLDKIKSENVVESVGFTAAIGSQNNLNDVVNRLKTISGYFRVGGAIFTVILAVNSFMVLLITITMRMVSRKEEIEILNLIGATQKFIRSPIMLEALLYTVAGVLIGWAGAFIAILYSAPSIVNYFGEITILPTEVTGLLTLFGTILGVEFVCGMVLAVSGSLLAISRARKVR